MSFWNTATTGIKWCTAGIIDATCLSGGFRTLSTAASFIPVYPINAAVGVGCELAALGCATIIEGKSFKEESAVAGFGCLASIIPFGKAGKAVATAIKGGEKEVAKGLCKTLWNEGFKECIKEVGVRAGKTATISAVDAGVKHFGRMAVGTAVYGWEEAVFFMDGVDNLKKCATKVEVNEEGKRFVKFEDKATGKVCCVEVTNSIINLLGEETAARLQLRSMVAEEIKNSGPIDRALDALKDGGVLGTGATALGAGAILYFTPGMSGYSGGIVAAIVVAGIFASYFHEDKFKRGFEAVADKQDAQKKDKGEEKAKVKGGRDEMVASVQKNHVLIDSTELASNDLENTLKPNQIAAKDKPLQLSF